VTEICVISGIDQIAQKTEPATDDLQAEVSANAEKSGLSQALNACDSKEIAMALQRAPAQLWN